MAADMSKKTSIYAEDLSRTKQTQDQVKTNRIYSSIRDCIAKVRESGRLFHGVQVAVVQQIPYSIVLFTSYEFFDSLMRDNKVIFSRFDDYSLWYKCSQRFGASTLAILAAAAVTHPIDTLKRRVQLNSTPGYSSVVQNGDKLPTGA